MPSRPIGVHRVGFFSPGWPAGAFANGIVSYTANVRQGLNSLGVQSGIVAGQVISDTPDPDIVSIRDLVGRPTLAERLFFRVIGPLFPKSFELRDAGHVVAAARELQRRAPIDIFEMEESFGLARRVARAIPAPVVVRLHGPWFLNGPALGVPQDAGYYRRVSVEGRTIREAAAVSAPSADVLARVRKEFQVELPDAEVIPNPGVVIPPEQRWRRSECNADEILFVGRFDRHKGGDLMIDAFAKLAARVPSVRLTFVGPDPGIDFDGRRLRTAEYLESHIPDRSVRARVDLLGPRNHTELPALRRRAFATVVASRYENFPMTALEACSFGSPLVASDAGGIPEIVVAGKTGLLFKAGDADDLASQLDALRRDPALAARLGEHAALDFFNRFRPEVVAQQTLDFYRRTLVRHSRSD